MKFVGIPQGQKRSPDEAERNPGKTAEPAPARAVRTQAERRVSSYPLVARGALSTVRTPSVLAQKTPRQYLRHQPDKRFTLQRPSLGSRPDQL